MKANSTAPTERVGVSLYVAVVAHFPELFLASCCYFYITASLVLVGCAAAGSSLSPGRKPRASQVVLTCNKSPKVSSKSSNKYNITLSRVPSMREINTATMDPSSYWKPYYVSLENQYLCSQPGVHRVGITVGHQGPLVELAVDPSYLRYYSSMNSFLERPNQMPVSVDTMISPDAVHQLGYQDAYTTELFKFLSNARSGIIGKGLGLGNFYRERYPKLQTWIEYFILMYDLQVSNLAKSRCIFSHDAENRRHRHRVPSANQQPTPATSTWRAR